MKFAPQEVRTYFVTAVCAERRRIFQTTANASLMLEVIQTNRTKNRMQIHAFVLMPDDSALFYRGGALGVSLVVAVLILGLELQPRSRAARSGGRASATSLARQFLPFASWPALARATTKSTSSWQRKKPSQ